MTANSAVERAGPPLLVVAVGSEPAGQSHACHVECRGETMHPLGRGACVSRRQNGGEEVFIGECAGRTGVTGPDQEVRTYIVVNQPTTTPLLIHTRPPPPPPSPPLPPLPPPPRHFPTRQFPPRSRTNCACCHCARLASSRWRR